MPSLDCCSVVNVLCFPDWQHCGNDGDVHSERVYRMGRRKRTVVYMISAMFIIQDKAVMSNALSFCFPWNTADGNLMFMGYQSGLQLALRFNNCTLLSFDKEKVYVSLTCIALVVIIKCQQTTYKCHLM